jgi:energy-converting hydrogenase Eha subunit G
MQKFFALLLQAVRKVGPILLLIQLVHSVLLSGLVGGAIANAYSLVTGGPDIAPAPAKAPA